jgi:hypothetical protein
MLHNAEAALCARSAIVVMCAALLELADRNLSFRTHVLSSLNRKRAQAGNVMARVVGFTKAIAEFQACDLGQRSNLRTDEIGVLFAQDVTRS